MSGGAVVWLTGLPGAGKTTLARALAARLAREGRAAHVLDGDEVRATFCRDLGFSRADRDENVRRASYVASHLSHAGHVVLAAIVSPYREARARALALCVNPREVWVRCGLEECRRRDPRGLYARAARGELRGLTGVDDPYEPPERPALVLDTETTPVDACVDALRALLP